MLLVTLILSVLSLGNLIQSSHSLDHYDSVHVTGSTDQDNNARDSLAGDVIFYPESTSHSVDDSGYDVDSIQSQKVTSKTLISKEQSSNKSLSGPGRTLTAALELALYHLQALEDQGTDKSNTSITEHMHTSVHIVTERSHTEEQSTNPSIQKDGYLGGE